MTSYNYTCPHCGAELEFDEDPTGQSLDCISCCKRFTVYSVNVPKRRQTGAKKQVLSRNVKNCYWLGIFFGVMGVFLANMSEGQDGSREALRGAILNFLIIAGGILVIFAAPAIANMISK